jgi:hypothetical protein
MKNIVVKLMPFAPAPCPAFAELPLARVLCNDVILPGEFNPHDVRLWVIGQEFGAVAAVWAAGEEAALDVMVDKGLGHEHAWIGSVEWDPSRDWRLFCAFSKARRANESALA